MPGRFGVDINNPGSWILFTIAMMMALAAASTLYKHRYAPYCQYKEKPTKKVIAGGRSFVGCCIGFAFLAFVPGFSSFVWKVVWWLYWVELVGILFK